MITSDRDASPVHSIKQSWESPPFKVNIKKRSQLAAVTALVCRKSLIFDVLLLYHSALHAIAATDSSFCRTALLGFAIRVGTPVNMKEGDNQRDQVRV